MTFMLFLLPLIYLILGFWIYYDAKRLRISGVNVYPGLAAGLVVLGFYLLPFLTLLLFDAAPQLLSYISNYSIAVLMIIANSVFPPSIYLALRFSKYRKIALQGKSALPQAPNWSFAFFIFSIIAPLFYPFLILLFSK